MTEITKKMLILTILTSGTQVINLPVGGFSIFQIILIFTGMITVVSILKIRTICLSEYIYYAMIHLLSCIMAYFLSTYYSWAQSSLLLGFMTTMFIISFPIFFTEKDMPLLIKTLIRSQYITIVFSIYTFIMFYFKGGLPEIIHLPLGMYIRLNEETIIRGQVSHHVRLMLPYDTPPVLSTVMAMCIVLLIYCGNVYSKQIKIPLIIIFSVILILTDSRTGIVALMVFFFIHYISMLLKGKHKRLLIITPVFFSPFIVIIFALSNRIEYISKFINRFNIMFMELSTNTSRHVLVPVDGIIIWLSNLKNFMLGIGFGSGYYMKGAHTYLPPHFLNSFVTMIVERGIMGLFLVILIFKLCFNMYKKRDYLSNSEKAIVYSLLVAVCASFLYETFNCYYVLITLAIVFTIKKYIQTNHSLFRCE